MVTESPGKWPRKGPGKSWKLLSNYSVCTLQKILLVWQAPLGVCNAKRRHQSSEWTILSHSYRLIQGEIVRPQFLHVVREKRSAGNVVHDVTYNNRVCCVLWYVELTCVTRVAGRSRGALTSPFTSASTPVNVPSSVSSARHSFHRWPSSAPTNGYTPARSRMPVRTATGASLGRRTCQVTGSDTWRRSCDRPTCASTAAAATDARDRCEPTWTQRTLTNSAARLLVCRLSRRQENSDCSSPEWVEKASWATLHLLDGHSEERPSSAQPSLGGCYRTVSE